MPADNSGDRSDNVGLEEAPAGWTLLASVRGDTARPFGRLTWSPQHKQVAAATRNGGVSVVDPDSGAELWQLPDIADRREIAWSPDGDHLAVLTRTGVSVHRATDGHEVVQFDTRRFDEPPRSAVWVGDDIVASGSAEGLALWDLPGERLHDLWYEAEDVVAVAFSRPDGVLAIATRYRGVVVADAGSGAELATIESGPSVSRRAADEERLYSTALGWSYLGATLAAGRTDGIVTVWVIRETGVETKELDAHSDIITAVSFAFDRDCWQQSRSTER